MKATVNYNELSSLIESKTGKSIGIQYVSGDTVRVGLNTPQILSFFTKGDMLISTNVRATLRPESNILSINLSKDYLSKVMDLLTSGNKLSSAIVWEPDGDLSILLDEFEATRDKIKIQKISFNEIGAELDFKVNL